MKEKALVIVEQMLLRGNFMGVQLDCVGHGGLWSVAGHIDGSEQERLADIHRWAQLFGTELTYGEPYADFLGAWRQRMETSGFVNGVFVRVCAYVEFATIERSRVPALVA